MALTPGGNFMFQKAKQAWFNATAPFDDFAAFVAGDEMHAVLLVCPDAQTANLTVKADVSEIAQLAVPTINNVVSELSAESVAVYLNSSVEVWQQVVGAAAPDSVSSGSPHTDNLVYVGAGTDITDIVFSSLADHDTPSYKCFGMLIAVAATPGTYAGTDECIFFFDEGGFDFIGSGSNVTYQLNANGLFQF